MLVLFPCNPLEPRQPDDSWKEEVEVAKNCGHEVAFVDHDELVDLNPRIALKRVPKAEEDENKLAIYRGWMVTSEQYEALYKAAQDRGVQLITTPEQYKNAHELPGWYAAVEDYTPTSTWVPKEEFLSPKMARLNTKALEELAAKMVPCIVKDYVKSRKHEWETACYIPDEESTHDVIQNFIIGQEEDNSFQGGIVFRQFVPLKSLGKHPQSGMPMSDEYRFFWLNGHVANLSEYWPTEHYEMETVELPEPAGGWKEGMERTVELPKSVAELPTFEELAAIARQIDSPFFVMDLARTEDDEWVLMEIGDGQVSGFPQGTKDAEKFYPSLDPLLSHVHKRPAPSPLTQSDFDRMICGVEGCDHQSHSGEMFLHPQCHIGSPTWCSYENGAISVTCSECKNLVARVAVDPGDVPKH